MDGLLHHLAAGKALVPPPGGAGDAAHPGAFHKGNGVGPEELPGGLHDIGIPALEPRGRDQPLGLRRVPDFPGQGKLQGQGLLHKEGDAPADGLKFDLPVAVGRDADEDHVRLHRVVHFLVVGEGPAAGPGRELLGALRDQVAEPGQLHVGVLEKMLQVVAADAAAADQR